jgi:hypothetical protein
MRELRQSICKSILETAGSNELCPFKQPSEDDEQRFIQQQCHHIFEIIFAPYFNHKDRENKANGLDIEAVLTYDQFEQAIQDHSWNSYQTGADESILAQ